MADAVHQKQKYWSLLVQWSSKTTATGPVYSSSDVGLPDFNFLNVARAGFGRKLPHLHTYFLQQKLKNGYDMLAAHTLHAMQCKAALGKQTHAHIWTQQSNVSCRTMYALPE